MICCEEEAKFVLFIMLALSIKSGWIPNIMYFYNCKSWYKLEIKWSLNIFVKNYLLVDKEWSGYEESTNLARIINCTYVVPFGAGCCKIPSKLEQESVFLVPTLLLAKEF